MKINSVRTHRAPETPPPPKPGQSFIRDVFEVTGGVAGGSAGLVYGASRGALKGVMTGIKEGMETKASPGATAALAAGNISLCGTIGAMVLGPVGMLAGIGIGALTAPAGVAGAVIKGAEGAVKGLISGVEKGFDIGKEVVKKTIDFF